MDVPSQAVQVEENFGRLLNIFKDNIIVLGSFQEEVQEGNRTYNPKEEIVDLLQKIVFLLVFGVNVKHFHTFVKLHIHVEVDQVGNIRTIGDVLESFELISTDFRIYAILVQGNVDLN